MNSSNAFAAHMQMLFNTVQSQSKTIADLTSRMSDLEKTLNETGGGVDSFTIAKQIGSDREVRTAGLTADLRDRSITEDQLRLALPKCVWRRD